MIPRSILFLLAVLGFVCRGEDARSVVASIGFDQKLDQPMALEVPFHDENGLNTTVGRYVKDKPVLLMFIYYDCPMLCSAQLSGLVSCLRAMKFKPGREFEIVALSINPADTPESSTRKKAEVIQSTRQPETGPGWHFLTGTKDAIDAVASSAGYRYHYDSTSGQFAHPSGILLLTPQGRISRYFYGIEYYPRDLELGLVEASHNKIGSVTDQVLLYCYRYDPMTGRYGVIIFNTLRIAAGLTVLTLLWFFIWGSRIRMSGKPAKPAGVAP